MRTHAHLTLAAALLVLQASCVKEVCREDSARIELAVKFSGFTLNDATRLEIEVHLKAPGAPSAGGIAYVRAASTSMAFPEAARATGAIQYVFDPGKYIAIAGQVDYVRIFFRAYGPDATAGERMLAEGIYATEELEATGCYRQKSVSVTPASICDSTLKFEGDPCVRSGGMGVCKGSAPNLTCEDSVCGGADGYTDRRGGEICDPSQTTDSTLLLDCTPECLPVAAIVSKASSPALVAAFPPQSLNLGGIPGQTSTEGYYDLVRGDPDAVGDRVGRLVFADLDGDSQTELAIGVPNGSVADPKGVPQSHVGVTIVQDPVTGSKTLGTWDVSRLLLAGAPPRGTQSHRSWFGASLAAGDVNGDGIDDLVVGAPMAATGSSFAAGSTGAAYLFQGGGGTNGAFQKDNGTTKEYVQMDTSGSEVTIRYHGFPGGDAEDSTLGGYPGGHFGYAVSIADLDLDGFSDIVISEPDAKTGSSIHRHGRVFVMRGAPGWIARAGSSATTDASLIIETETPFVRFGTSLTTGDLNGDGYPDLVIGSAPTSDSTAVISGAVSILFGRPTEQLYQRKDLTAYGVASTQPPTGGDLVNLTDDADTYPGIGAVLAALDLDGDGLDDLVTTLGRLADTAGDATSFEEPYRVLLIRGSALADAAPGTPLSLDPADVVTLEGPTDAGFGLELFAADVNGDRRRDLIIAAPLQNGVLSGKARTGAFYVLYATPRFDYWAARTYDLSSPGTWDTDPPALPVIAIEGSTTQGWYGTGFATSSHFAFALNAAQYSDSLANRRALSYVFEGGMAANVNVPLGTIYTLHLPGLFCCGTQCPCSPTID